MNFKFGEKVLVKASLKRQKGKPSESGYITPAADYRYWHREEFDNPQEAIFLGNRTLQNGSYGYENFGDGDFDWNPEVDERIPGAWICRKGRNPEKVFLSDVEKIPVRRSMQNLLEVIGQEILETYGLEVEEN